MMYDLAETGAFFFGIFLIIRPICLVPISGHIRMIHIGIGGIKLTLKLIKIFFVACFFQWYVFQRDL